MPSQEPLQHPNVSIVVPTFNQGCYIEQCLSSIESQTERNIEVLIQDSCSTDDTESICIEFARRDARFKYFREKDSGQSDALNRGLQRSKGLFWTWICSDDFYSNSRALEKLTTAIHPSASDASEWAGTFGEAELVSESGTHLEKYITQGRNIHNRDFKMYWPFSQPASIIYRSRVLKVGGINSELHLGMDLDLFIRITDKGKQFKYVPEPIASVRVQPNSKSVKLSLKTAECALGIVKYYFGSVGFPLHSQYSVSLGTARVEAIKTALRSKRTNSHGDEGLNTQQMKPRSNNIFSKASFHAYRFAVRLGSRVLAKYVLSINSGRFFSYYLLRKQQDTLLKAGS